MYKIIKDPALACELRDVGLLWWVSMENGGYDDSISHVRTTVDHTCIRNNIERGCFGIQLEE